MTMLENVPADRRGQLERAFQAFNQLSDQLQTSYQVLEQRVSALTAELEESRQARDREARYARGLAARLELLLATLPAGVVVVDSGGLIQETNPAAEGILGAGLTGKLWQEVATRVFAERVSAGGEWLTADARRVSIFSSALDAQGARILLLTDVTETRALEELVHRNQRLSAMGEMAASLAHQIRTPLASALLYLSQCRSRAEDARLSECLEQGIGRLHHLDRLVQDMLVFARGHGPGERVRIADLFADVYRAAAALKPPNAHLVIDGADVLLELEGNRTALVAALTNLVSNAFEAAADVVVTLTAEVRGKRVELKVQDNGPGIAPAIQSRVFEPFFSTRPSGTGLGLAVVKTVAEAHGGGLELDSALNAGTSVGIELPTAGGRDAGQPLEWTGT
jgi:two-component system sensor histidine kinase FlrB